MKSSKTSNLAAAGMTRLKIQNPKSEIDWSLLTSAATDAPLPHHRKSTEMNPKQKQFTLNRAASEKQFPISYQFEACKCAVGYPASSPQVLLLQKFQDLEFAAWFNYFGREV